MDSVSWIRGRGYGALSFCQTGPEIIDCCAAALARYADKIAPEMFWAVMVELSKAEPHTSYRTPLALECAMLNMFEIMRTSPKIPFTALRCCEGISRSEVNGEGSPEDSSPVHTSPQKKGRAVRSKAKATDAKGTA